MVSTEDEDEVPYDAYAQNMASEDPPALEDKASSEEKEEGEEEEEENKEDTEEMMPEATDTQENKVTNLVRCGSGGIAIAGCMLSGG